LFLIFKNINKYLLFKIDKLLLILPAGKLISNRFFKFFFFDNISRIELIVSIFEIFFNFSKPFKPIFFLSRKQCLQNVCTCWAWNICQFHNCIFDSWLFIFFFIIIIIFTFNFWPYLIFDIINLTAFHDLNLIILLKMLVKEVILCVNDKLLKSK
jgi:hypothetical protein